MDLGLGNKPGLAKCPTCQQVIDSASRSCRFCGTELDATELHKAAESHHRQIQEAARKNNRRALIAGIVSLTAAVIGVGLWFGGQLWLRDWSMEVKRGDRIEQLIRQRDFDGAISLTREYLRSDPDDADLHFLLGKSLALKKDAVNALEEFERVRQLDPNHSQAPFFAGLLLYEKKQYVEADAMLTTGMELGFKSVDALKFRGLSRAMLAKTDLAMEDFKAAEQLGPKAFRVDCGLGMVDAMKDDRDSAIRHLQSCVDQLPNDSLYRLLLTAQKLQ